MQLPTIDIAHMGWVTIDAESEQFQASCRCGWSSDWTDDPDVAELAAAEHPDRVAAPADGLDLVMGELLDILDDLASVVVWLAENWSADLPVPSIHAGGGGSVSPATIQVWAACADHGDLTRIAHLLGVPPLDDERPDACGLRYRRAARSFGRVLLKAFTALEEVPVP